MTSFYVIPTHPPLSQDAFFHKQLIQSPLAHKFSEVSYHLHSLVWLKFHSILYYTYHTWLFDPQNLLSYFLFLLSTYILFYNDLPLSCNAYMAGKLLIILHVLPPNSTFSVKVLMILFLQGNSDRAFPLLPQLLAYVCKHMPYASVISSLNYPCKRLNRMPAAAAAAKSLQSCPTLCDPIDGSPPGSPVPGILQARKLEWAAIAFSQQSAQHTVNAHQNICYYFCVFITKYYPKI